jgi:hypothetical protein
MHKKILIGGAVLVVLGALMLLIARGGESATNGIAKYDSGIRGTVLLGPTCPVQRMPPDPGCADKPYATDISVYRTGSSEVFATTQSDASGMFEFSLPPGNYTLRADGGAVMPTCASVDTVVGPSAYVTTNIPCDTGIR